MSWIQKLYETYDHIGEKTEPLLWPISHFVKNAHIEVVIDGNGNFKDNRVKLLAGEDAPTLIPATEASAGKSGAKVAPHPLCDEIGYCASGYPEINPEKSAEYLKQIEAWSNSEFSHPKVKAINSYLKKNRLWQDLSKEVEFPFNFKSRSGATTKIVAEKAFIRWRVEDPGNPISATWQDDELINLWIKYDNKYNSNFGFCYVEGSEERSANNHPRFIRNAGDGGKLISSNDKSGFTFRGRFTEPEQVTGVSFDVTQKAHNALRWLISRQGFRNGDQAIVAWAVSGKEIPQPMADTLSFLENKLVESISDEVIDENETDRVDHTIDVGQSFAQSLNRYMAGYNAKLNPTESVVIMGLDSATPGRMAITYYRETFAKEFIDQITKWHEDFAWYQRYKLEKKTIWPISAPSPKDIWGAVYGERITDTLKKNLIERIMPCIIEGRAFPQDIVNQALRIAVNRNAYKNDEFWLWEKHMGIACGLYKGFCKRHPDLNKRREYTMSLEENNNSRDYLYGRLLAVADHMEEYALYLADEKRTTNAARFMQYFADRPFTTWRNIELALQPSKHRLYNNRRGFVEKMEKELGQICSQFTSSEFTNDAALSGEFLLAYHVQRQALRKKKDDNNEDDNNQND